MLIKVTDSWVARNNLLILIKLTRPSGKISAAYFILFYRPYVFIVVFFVLVVAFITLLLIITIMIIPVVLLFLIIILFVVLFYHPHPYPHHH